MDNPDLRKLGLMPSVLDRLIDPKSLGTKGDPGFSLSELVASVRRDLEELLNTRQNQDREIDAFPLLAQSVYRFGLPEVVTLKATSLDDRQKIARMIERTIVLHEPRLTNVRATLVDNEKNFKNSTLNYRVEARLRLEPAPELVFETLLEFATGKTSIEEASIL